MLNLIPRSGLAGRIRGSGNSYPKHVIMRSGCAEVVPHRVPIVFVVVSVNVEM